MNKLGFLFGISALCITQLLAGDIRCTVSLEGADSITKFYDCQGNLISIKKQTIFPLEAKRPITEHIDAAAGKVTYTDANGNEVKSVNPITLFYWSKETDPTPGGVAKNP